MQLNLSPEMEARLARIAANQGRDAESVVLDAVERLLSYDEWIHTKVKHGIASADRGETLSHEEVGRRLEERIDARMNRP